MDTQDPIPDISPPAFPIETPASHGVYAPFLTALVFILTGISVWLAYQNIMLRRSLARYEGPPSEQSGQNNDGWTAHVARPLGIRFRLPKTLGLLEGSGTEVPGDTGLQYCMVYAGDVTVHLFPRVSAGGGPCGGGTFSVGSVTQDYSAGREGGFGDFTGYEQRRDQYYPRFIDTVSAEPLPRDAVSVHTNAHGITYLRVMGKTVMQDYGGEQMLLPVLGTPGEGMIGALINLQGNAYPGFNMSMKLTNPGDEAVFDRILQSIAPVK